jgi:hypothetical protein
LIDRRKKEHANVVAWHVQLFNIGEGPAEYTPFCDLRSVTRNNHGRVCTQVLFLSKAELGFFDLLEIVTSWAGGTFLPLVIRSQYSSVA